MRKPSSRLRRGLPARRRGRGYGDPGRAPARVPARRRGAANEPSGGTGGRATREARETGLVAREQELVAAAKAAKPGTEEWTRARRELKRFRAGRTRYVPMPSADRRAGLRADARATAAAELWDNPYRPPRGATVVGS